MSYLVGRSRAAPYLVAGALLVASHALPFLDHAWHVDCQVYLMGAKIVRHDPARPLSHTTGYLGQTTPYHRGVNSHPQGLPFYLAAAQGLTGAAGEAPTHLVLLPLLLLFGVGTYLLARELRRVLSAAGAERLAGAGGGDALDKAGWAALLALGAAPTVVNSHALFTEIPMMALMTTGLALLLRAHRRGGALNTIGAVLLCNTAWFMQYRALLILPLGLALLVWQRRRPPLRTVLILTSLPAALAGWCTWNLWELGETHFFFSSAQLDYSAARLLHTTTALLSYAGGLLFPLAALVGYALWRRPQQLVTLAVAAAVAGALLAWGLPHTVDGPRMLIGSLCALGAFTVAGAGLTAWSARDHFLLARPLALTIWGLFAVQCVAALFGCSRMLLLPLPFMLIGLTLGAPRPGPLWLRGVVLTAGLLLGLVISTADARFADAYRLGADAAVRLAHTRAPDTGPGQGYFVGEWGLRTYLERRGLRYLTADDASPHKGDYLVIPELACPWPVHPSLKARLGPAHPLPLVGACAIRTMDPLLGAALHTDGYGVLPYVWADHARPYDTLRVYQVVR